MVDTNVLVALLGGTAGEAAAARRSLSRARGRGAIVVSAPVYAELAAAPGRGAAAVDEFLERTRIEVDWVLDEGTWRMAAAAFGAYAERRRSGGETGPRRILADFVIGAHASRYASVLLTLDEGLYRAAFPDLNVAAPG